MDDNSDTVYKSFQVLNTNLTKTDKHKKKKESWENEELLEKGGN